MSKETLHLKAEVYGICEKAGLDPNLVASIIIEPDVVGFLVYVEPKQQGADGPLVVHEFRLWDRK